MSDGQAIADVAGGGQRGGEWAQGGTNWLTACRAASMMSAPCTARAPDPLRTSVRPEGAVPRL